MYFMSQWPWYYNYNKYTMWQRYGFLFLLVGTLFYGWHTYVYTYLEQRITHEESLIVSLHKDYAQQLDKKKQNQELVNRMQTIKNKVQDEQLYHKKISLQENVSMLFDHISRAGLLLLSYNADKEIQKAGHCHAHIHCVVHGTAAQFIQSLELIKQSQQSIVVSDIQMTHIDNNLEKISCTYNVRFYA